ncbi:unnamed protein product [Trifolium pratense]|uniref:Uncharacterized protein n=1 Tax=Trifolium pratense TaxID=57577 RepID=A0ACB0K635_TRIPR|nr:unnamed protein product [Trifolium pratense]
MLCSSMLCLLFYLIISATTYVYNCIISISFHSYPFFSDSLRSGAKTKFQIHGVNGVESFCFEYQVEVLLNVADDDGLKKREKRDTLLRGGHTVTENQLSSLVTYGIGDDDGS